jgi:hypothetical protein
VPCRNVRVRRDEAADRVAQEPAILQPPDGAALTRRQGRGLALYGASIPPALDGMERGLAGWDGSIRAYAMEYPTRHFAVGVLQLDRGHATEAGSAP